jgi:mannose-6-phosphate isomerase
MLYPLTFRPQFKERVWGGRNLERLYGKPLPPGVPIGESWEITDRPEGVSAITNGPHAGRDLRWLMETHGSALLGHAVPPASRFPILVKILDATERLSLQVHPPAAVADRLGGEPKTELWYVAEAKPDAELYVGLKSGVRRAVLERHLREGTVAQCVHRVPVQAGDAMFLPSGRLHAIGAGLVLFEIQQNSDTTYRVHDWGRTGLDGQPRELHLEQALQSIDFHDFEPGLVPGRFVGEPACQTRRLVSDPLFAVRAVRLEAGRRTELAGSTAQVLGVVRGALTLRHGTTLTSLSAGQFCLLPAGLDEVDVTGVSTAEFLVTTEGERGG